MIGKYVLRDVQEYFQKKNVDKTLLLIHASSI